MRKNKSEKSYLLEEVIRALYPELPENFAALIDDYTSKIEKYGLNSKEVSDLYAAIIKKHSSMKEWLDIQNSLFENLGSS